MFAGENGLQGDPRLKAIYEAIRVVPHFPKPGLSLRIFIEQFVFLMFLYFVSVFFFLFKYPFPLVFCFEPFWDSGIMFQDITTLLLNHKAFKDTVDIFVDRYRDMDISVVAGNLSFSLF